MAISEEGIDVSRDLARRGMQGGVVMIGRQAVSIVATFAGGVVLARSLSPAEFGAYALLMLVINVAGIVTDPGLSATLIRQPYLPRTVEVASVFTVLAGLTLAAVSVVVVGIPVVELWGPAVSRLDLALGLVALSFVGLPLTSVGLAMLEARLAFRAVGVVLASQTIVFNVIAALFALSGAGIVSVGAASAASSLWAGVLSCVLARWRPRLTKRLDGLRDRLAFGIPYISASLVSVLKDAITPLFIGVAFGAAAAGYINWAQTLAVAGMLMLFPLVRVFFPIFSKVRHDSASFDVAIVRSLFWSYAIAAPVTVFLLLNMRSVTVVVYGDQWLPALTTVLWLTAANVLSPAANVYFVALNVMGRPRTTLAYTVAYLVATWVLVPLAATVGSYPAYGWANFLVTLINIPLILQMRAHLRGHAVDMLRPWVAAIVSVGLAGLVSEQIRLEPTVTLAVSAVIAVPGYFIALWLLGNRYVREALNLRVSRGATL